MNIILKSLYLTCIKESVFFLQYFRGRKVQMFLPIQDCNVVINIFILNHIKIFKVILQL